MSEEEELGTACTNIWCRYIGVNLRLAKMVLQFEACQLAILGGSVFIVPLYIYYLIRSLTDVGYYWDDS